jgi:hypothetical protein
VQKAHGSIRSESKMPFSSARVFGGEPGDRSGSDHQPGALDVQDPELMPTR